MKTNIHSKQTQSNALLKTTTLVVRKMGVLGSFSTTSQTELIGKMTENANNKIPLYARDYKREYQFIRGINKEFKYFINKLDNLNNGLFESNISNRIKYFIKRFLRGQEKGKLKDISDLVLQREDLDNLIFINEHFGYYKLRYDAFDDDSKPYPGFKEIYDIFKLFFNQINYNDFDSDSDFDYDSDIEIEIVLPDSDCDSDYF